MASFNNILISLFLLFFRFHQSTTSDIEKTFNANKEKLFQIVQDPKTQDVYVGGRNRLYHLDSALNLKQELVIGPVNDSQKCFPGRKCKSKISTDNDIVFLEIEPFSNMLLACGTVKQGACIYYHLKDIKDFTKFDAIKAENFVGSRNTTVAFFDSNLSSNTSILYVAMSYDGRLLEAFPKIISERVISKSQTGLYNLSYRKSYLGIPTNKNTINQFRMKYLYGFKHMNFIYYVSLQPKGTYIGRVCEFSEFYYYVEIKLECWHGTQTWNYATAAKLVKNKNGDILTVAYGKEKYNETILCHHAMSSIRDNMGKAIRNCYEKRTDFDHENPIWIDGNKKCVETYHSEINQDTCGSDEYNGYITGDKASDTSKFYTKGKVTAIQSYMHHGRNILILGTAHGHLLKIGNRSEIMMDYDISGNTGQPIEPDMELDANKSHVYAISGSKVIRFPLKSCSVYTSCSTCVTTNDPLDCGWCHDECTTRGQCNNSWSPDCCVPQIKSITPTSGPVAGGTRLTIRGNYFHNDDPSIVITVKIGSAMCRIISHNYTEIICETLKEPQSTKGNVHVKISARQIKENQPKIEGEGSSGEIFHFMIPEIYNFTPFSGPKSGGTNCNITGINLDIGSTLSLWLRDHKFLIKKKTQHTIFAMTQKVDFLIEGPLQLRIDNQTLITKNSFKFKPDPEITNIDRPYNTIKSGGIDISFWGKNLNTVQNPMLSAVIVTNKDPLPAEKCTSNDIGTVLYCKTPVLNDNSNQSIPVDLRLHMDGVKHLYNMGLTLPKFSRIIYNNDPVLYKFDSKQNVFLFTESTNEVMIKGDSINTNVDQQDINITIGDANCQISSLTSNSIHCKPQMAFPKNSKHHKFQVLVRIGYRTYNIGWLLFVSSKSAAVNVPIIVLIVIILCIIGVIIILFYVLWRKKLFIFKNKHENVPAARYSANDQVRFGENGRLIIAPNEYTERQNFQPATPTAGVGAASFPLIDENILLVLGDKNLLIPKESLQITEKIGQGHFGCVYRALYRKPGEKGEMLVAVKTLHKDHPRDLDIQGFLDEALIMKDFDHKNILSLIGICLGKDHMPLVVLPYMAYGDLLSYLRNVNNQPTVKDLIIFGISIASGMDYLAGLKFVHRDLAARNCMLNDKLVVKVADFGLSRDIYERDYYSSDNKKSKLPVKWMALESLENGTYNTKTDVWSYGVVLWELFTRGVNPYPTVDNWDMPRYLKLGRRMDKPDYCPNRIYDIMLRCWEFDQNLRPDFASIVNELTELSEMERHRDLPCYQKTPYENVEY